MNNVKTQVIRILLTFVLLFIILKVKSQDIQEYWILVYNNNFENKELVKSNNVELKELPDSNGLILYKGAEFDTLYFDKELNNYWPCASYIYVKKRKNVMRFYYNYRKHSLKVDSRLKKLLFKRSSPYSPDHCSHSSHYSHYSSK